VTTAPYGYDQVIARLREVLPGRARAAPRWVGRPAAVAALLVDRGGAPFVPLIVRGADAPAHPGQIALPGGRVEPSDGSVADAAVREAFEELGVPPDRVEVLGVIDDVPTPTNFVITPVVARFDARDLAYRADPREVASWFEVPLQLFADRANGLTIGERTVNGVTYLLRAYDFGEHRIWGATARVLEALADLL
jgi:8-oxo-dGTP pyrophosphatase MutT (NUDIX family)